MAASTQTLTTQVKAHAQGLGFQLVGIAPAEHFVLAEARYANWVARGFQGQMAWITPERTARSSRPQGLLPGARSIIGLGVSYYAEEREYVPAPGPHGRVARYAWGADYHTELQERMRALVGFIEDVGGPEARTRVFVDTAPLLEREAAVRAGLGFYGKNTNLLTAELGSWLVLGCVITTLDLEPDAPMLRDCGQCRLCLDACPTEAFPEPYVLDAQRCISYLTIELRDSIPRELRPSIGDRIFGCDVCQDVCPWNRRLDPLAWPELSPRGPDSARPQLAALLELDDEAFRARFRGTAVTRTKRRGLLRNVAVALGNSADQAAVPPLVKALDDSEPLVRGHAAWALGRLGGRLAVRALARALEREQDAGVREEIRLALAAQPHQAQSK